MMKRGDIFFAALDPTVGSEIQKTRPVLIVSNNASNRAAALLTVVPITSNTKKVFPFEVLLEKEESQLQKKSKAQCHQVRTISKIRVSGKKSGGLNTDKMREVDAALKLHLHLK